MNFAIGIALEGGHVKRGMDLGLRLAWTQEQDQTIDQILQHNALPPVLHDFTVYTMSVGRCAILSVNQEHFVIVRNQRQLWSIIGQNKFETQITALELQARFPNAQAHVMPLVRGWEPQFRLYWRLEDALCDRAPNEHVFAIDWSNKLGKDGNSKRFLLCSEPNIDLLADFLAQRPRCDCNLYTINMAGLLMRLIQLDVEAMLDLNPHLKTLESQQAYANEIVNQLRRFLKTELPEVLITFASDETRFSCHIYIQYDNLPDQEAHDNMLIQFWEWLWTRPDHQQLLIYHRFPPNKTLGRGFAIDVLAGGRNREMRGPLQGKQGKREFRLPPGWTMAAALRFVLPNRLSPSPPPPPPLGGGGDIHTAYYQRNDTGALVELCNTSGRPPPEDTFLYKFPDLYRFLSPYRTDRKKDANVMWMQGKVAKHNQREERHVETYFAVPTNKYNELLALQAKAPRPTMLHDDASQGTQRPFGDVDGTRINPVEAARAYAHFSKSRVAIKLAPPNPKDQPGFLRFHLIAFDAALSGPSAQHAHRWHFDKHMRSQYTEADWPVGCLDMAPTCLRHLGGDKPDDYSGAFSNRVHTFLGYYDPETDSLIQEHPQPHHICSIHTTKVVDEEAERLHLFTPDYCKEPLEIKGDAYDPTNEKHRALAEELALLLAHYPDYKGNVTIQSVQKEDDSWTIQVGHFCLKLNQQLVQGTKRATPGRPSMFEHLFNRGKFHFYPTRIVPSCSDKECNQKREFPYSSPNTQRILFSIEEEEDVADEEKEVVALDYIRAREGSSVGWKHVPRLHAYKKNSLLVKVPHACYIDTNAPDALLFHAFAPDSAVAFSNDVFTLSNSRKVSLDDLAPESHPVRHHVFHIRRMRRIFHSVDHVRFDQVPRLWNYDLTAPLTERETWYTFSGKGTGKTHQNIRIIGNQFVQKPRVTPEGHLTWSAALSGGREARILILSPLIAVAGFYALPDKYDAANYDDSYFRENPHALARQTRLVCSLESLHKLPPNYRPDVVLMDESEWLLQVLSGKTMLECRQLSWARFRTIMQSAKLVVASDSRLDKKTYNCLHELRKGSVERLFYNFQAENGNKYTQYVSEAAWLDKLQAAIERRDGPIFLPTNSKEQALQLQNFIRKHDPEASILLITADTYHDPQNPYIKQAVTHCNEEWVKFRYVIMTPVVGPAVDFNERHFRYCFAWATPQSGTPAQFFQMIGRVRHLLSLHVEYFINRSYSKKQPQAKLTEDSIKAHILQSAKDTARLGIQLTADASWNIIEQAFQHGVYDQLFFDIHVANMLEEKLGKARFSAEFASLIKEQQGIPPLVCDAPGSDEQRENIKRERAMHRADRKEAEWNAFSSAPEITAAQAAAIECDMKRGRHIDAERLQSRKRFAFRSAYALDEDHDITRQEFEDDSPERRMALRNHQEVVLRPRVEHLLAPHDRNQLVRVVKKQRTMADLHLKALSRQQQEQVLRIFGFPRDACVALVLHDLSPNLHVVTSDYCDKLMVLDQLRLLSLPMSSTATGITFFRSFLSEQWDVSLVANKRIRKRLCDAFRIHGSDALDIVQRHFPNYNYTIPPSRRVSEQCLIVDDPAWLAFVLAFSPRHLPAFPAGPCTVDEGGFVPTRLEGDFAALDFPKLCKKHCPDGLLLSFGNKCHLYYQYEQFWSFSNDMCTEYASAAEAAQAFPPVAVGTLFLAPSDRRRLLLREAPGLDAIANWPMRFLQRVVL